MDDATDALPTTRPAPLELSPILQASLDAFYEDGFHGTSVRDIAARVGMTAPALYYHHANKEALLLALLQISLDDVAVRVERADARGDDPVDRLRLVTEAIALTMTQFARLSALDAESRYLGAENHARHAAARRRIELAVRAIVQDGVATGAFRADDPAETTRAILGMLQSIPRWFDAQGRDAPEDVAAKYVDIVLRTAGHDPTG